MTERLFNPDYLKQFSAGNDEFIPQMIEMFLEDMPESFNELKMSYESGNYQGVSQAAHKMKSTFGFFGIESGRKLMLDLERPPEQEYAHPAVKDRITEAGTVLDKIVKELEVFVA